jgi:hypothetical protein
MPVISAPISPFWAERITLTEHHSHSPQDANADTGIISKCHRGIAECEMRLPEAPKKTPQNRRVRVKIVQRCLMGRNYSEAMFPSLL